MLLLPIRELGDVARAKHGFLTVPRKTLRQRPAYYARAKYTYSHNRSLPSQRIIE